MLKTSYKKISDIPNFKNNFEWDKENWSKSILYFEKLSKKKISECKVLELGSRKGHLGKMFHMCGAEVILSDIKNFLDKEVIDYLSTNKKISFEIIDATKLYKIKFYDIIIFKSMLGGLSTIDRQTQCLNNIYTALKDDGEFWFMENLKSSWIHDKLREIFVNWYGMWKYPEKQELLKILEINFKVNYQSRGVLSLFGKTERQKKFLTFIDNFLINFSIFKKMHTIFFGFAKKKL